MQPSLFLLAIAAIVGTSACHAETIQAGQPATPMVLSQTAHPDAKAQSIAIHHEVSPNWAHVLASRDANGNLTARCVVEPNPQVAALRAGKTPTTTTWEHQK